LEGKLAALIKNYPPEVPVLAAVSGGADSVAMLTALAALVNRNVFQEITANLPKKNLPKNLKGNLHCLHVNHGIRPEAECTADANFVRSLCEKLNIDCRVVVISPGKIASFAHCKGIGIEGAARHFRYRALFRRARELGCNTRICIAHTKDELLETLLMRILRGASPQGLSPMSKPVSPRIVRPLLETTRAEVLEYLKEKNISWREDSSNSDINYLRNKIRHNFIPVLNKDFPGWEKGLLSMSQTQSLAAAFIQQETETQIPWHFQGIENSSPLTAFTDTQNFLSRSQIIREESIFLAIDKLLSGRRNFKTVKRTTVRKFCTGGINAVDLGPVQVSKTTGKVQISIKKNVCSENGFSLLIKKPGLYTLKNIMIEVFPYTGQDKKGGFCTGLPVAIRGSYSGSKESLTIHDMPREAGTGQMLYLVTINTGGINV
jgi:tRNA(Ile)-lysidine synthase